MQPGRSNNPRSRVAENRGASKSRGRSGEVGRNGPPAAVPVSPKASPRASVAASTNPGRAVGRVARDLHINEVRPSVQRFVVSNRPAEYITGDAFSYAFLHRLPVTTLVIAPTVQ